MREDQSPESSIKSDLVNAYPLLIDFSGKESPKMISKGKLLVTFISLIYILIVSNVLFCYDSEESLPDPITMDDGCSISSGSLYLGCTIGVTKKSYPANVITLNLAVRSSAQLKVNPHDADAGFIFIVLISGLNYEV